MGRKIHPKARTIKIDSKSNNEFFLIHGYTGSPTDFRDLPLLLNKNFDAVVYVPRIIGHGTDIRDLDNLTYEDFYRQVENELKKELKKGRKIVLGGLSLGGIIALELSSKYPSVGIFTISVPYYMTWPFKLITFIEPVLPWKYWKKSVSNYEKQMREGSFHYPYVHSRGLTVVKEFKTNFKNILRNVKVPCMNIHCKYDYLTNSKSIDFIKENIGSKIVKNIVYDNKDVHNLFFSKKKDRMFKDIIKFFKDIDIFEK